MPGTVIGSSWLASMPDSSVVTETLYVNLYVAGGWVESQYDSNLDGCIIIILILHLSVRPCVRESGRSREAIRPVLKNFPFSGSLVLDTTQKSPLTQPAMAPALDYKGDALQ